MRRRLGRRLQGSDIFFVGVHGGLDAMERRSFHGVLAHGAYDADLDASSVPAELKAEKAARAVARPETALGVPAAGLGKAMTRRAGSAKRVARSMMAERESLALP